MLSFKREDAYDVICKDCGRIVAIIDSYTCHDRNPVGPYCSQCATKSKFPIEPEIRTFSTGATRDTEANKPDYEGFLSPIVLQRFGEYMSKHRKQSDGQLRDSDNWQKGIPLSAYIKSGWRHFMDWWLEYRGHKSREGLEDALCGLLFNVCGYLHEVLKAKEQK